MKFECPNCGQHLEADADMASMNIECPTCHKQIKIPPSPLSSATDVSLVCQNCGECLPVPAEWAGEVVSCPTCGADARVPTPAERSTHKDKTTTSTNFSGFFTIDSQTRGSRIAWIISIPISLAVLVLGIHLANDALHNRGMGHAPDGMEILLFLMFFFVLPGLLVLAGVRKLFQRPGLYFTGIRTTPNGFEAGSLTVDLASVEPRDTWRRSQSGRVLTGKWTPEKKIAADPLSVVIFLKEDRNAKRHYFFERFILASKETVLHQFSGAKSVAETNSNDIVAMLNGSFELLGGSGAVSCQHLLGPLERSADVLSTAASGHPLACTLSFVAKTVGGDKVLLFGLVGALVAAGIDSRRKGKLEASFRNGRLFDADLTQKLADFAESRGWTITAGGK